MTFAKSPNINYLWAGLMIEELIRNGVNYFCISSGSRSSPLTASVSLNIKAKSFVHLDERASAYHALGYAAATKKPCAVITTSGTAAANLYPAIIEASKKKLPLIILTADRPPELRNTGANQTIDQVKMYGDYVRWFFDIPTPSCDAPPEFILTTIDQAVSKSQGELKGPVHLNCMFREPLDPRRIPTKFAQYLNSIKTWQSSKTPYTKYVKPKLAFNQSDINETIRKIKNIRSGIIAVGKLSNDEERAQVLKLSEKLNWPIFPDITSGLRLGNSHLNIIHYFDQILLSENIAKKCKPDGVLHLGGRITSKRWYEFIEQAHVCEYIMVLNHPLRNDPLHNVTTRVQCSIPELCQWVINKLPMRKSPSYLKLLQNSDQKVDQLIEQYLNHQNGINEPTTARLISQYIPKDHALFLASSLPIREMDMFAAKDKHSVEIGSNRGASGIDGTIASATGFSVGLKKRVTLLIGDLAFLYDLNALIMLKSLKFPMTIVLLNNDGGGIFNFLPISRFTSGFEKFFGTPHGLTFKPVSEMFNIKYMQPKTSQQFDNCYQKAVKANTSSIIEVNVERKANVQQQRKLQNRIKIFNQSFVNKRG